MLEEIAPPQQMFRMITGYWVTQLVGALAEEGLPDRLAAGPLTAEELATQTGLPARALYRVLRGAASVGLMRGGATPDEPFTLTPLGDTLRSDVPGSMRDMARAQSAPGHWLPWGRFRDVLRTGERQTAGVLGGEIFEHYRQNPAEAAAFSGAMANLAALAEHEVVRLVQPGDARTVVDVGGATGRLAAALLDAHPQLRGIVVDLPHVASDAREALGARGLGERCQFVGGDFFREVPAGDLYVLKQVLHDWDDAQCITILGHVARAMRPGGRVVVVEMVVPEDGSPSPAPMMDLNMLALLPGRERSLREYGRLFAEAGLRLERMEATHSPFDLVEAVRA